MSLFACLPDSTGLLAWLLSNIGFLACSLGWLLNSLLTCLLDWVGWSAGVTAAYRQKSRLGGDVFEMLEKLLISHWNKSKEGAHNDSRKVVVEIPYPLRSDNLLTCLMSFD
jgi:hypothetical protein